MLINCISLDRMRCSDYSKCQHMHEQSMNHISLKKYRPQMLCKVTHCAGRAHGASYTQEMQLVTKRLTIFMPISVESIDGYGQLLPEGNHMIEKQQRPQNLVSHSCHDQISNYNCRVIGTFCCQHFVHSCTTCSPACYFLKVVTQCTKLPPWRSLRPHVVQRTILFAEKILHDTLPTGEADNSLQGQTVLGKWYQTSITHSTFYFYFG